jgi:trehalose 6-phosphate synthase/phosphatase
MSVAGMLSGQRLRIQNCARPASQRSIHTAKRRLLIVSNRLPVTAKVEMDCLTMNQSCGGLATGLSGPHGRTRGLWVGWIGAAREDVEAHRAGVATECLARRYVPVELTRSEVDGYYNRACNEVLWPLFHDMLDKVPLRQPDWGVYERVNARFADVVADCYQPGDAIWVHDYQLLLLPALLRERLPDARIGFFLHIPFPAAGIEALPARDDVIRGLAGADVIGFHTNQYLENFRVAARCTRGISCETDSLVRVNGRQVALGVFPMGIDAAAFAARARSTAAQRDALALKGLQRLLVGVDRLDYTKGIPRRILAIEDLLQRHPEWRGKIRLIQICAPSRTRVRMYRRYRREVDEHVARINGKFGTATWSPIQYISKSMPMETLAVLYRAADVMLVTPLRDGMNLVAQEFIASRVDGDGVLVLSKLAGAAAELHEAVQVNPYDTRAMAEAIHQALTMSFGERVQRMQRLRTRVFSRDVHWWADSFLDALS